MAHHKRLRCNTFEGQCFVGDDNIQKPRTLKSQLINARSYFTKLSKILTGQGIGKNGNNLGELMSHFHLEFQVPANSLLPM